MNAIIQGLRNEKRIRGFIISYFAIGVVGMAFPITKPVFEQLTGLTILISFILMMLYHQGWTIRFVLAALIICIAGFAVEAVGVRTGAVFGHYAYHASLGPKLLETPLIMGVNWFMLVYAIYHLTLKINLHYLLRPFVNALCMVIYDILLEPVAIHWNMWKWEGHAVPLKNYFAWFVISLLFFILIQSLRLKYKNRMASLILVAQCCFFILLNLVIHLIHI